MSEFTERQLALANTQFADFQHGSIGLDAMLRRIEGIARALGDDFWAETIFPYALDLEQINANVLEECRGLTEVELEHIGQIVAKMGSCFAQYCQARDQEDRTQ